MPLGDLRSTTIDNISRPSRRYLNIGVSKNVCGIFFSLVVGTSNSHQ